MVIGQGSFRPTILLRTDFTIQFRRRYVPRASAKNGTRASFRRHGLGVIFVKVTFRVGFYSRCFRVAFTHFRSGEPFLVFNRVRVNFSICHCLTCKLIRRDQMGSLHPDVRPSVHPIQRHSIRPLSNESVGKLRQRGSVFV